MSARAKTDDASARSARKPRVWVGYYGGTIGMVETAAGYAPVRGHLLEVMGASPALERSGVPRFDVEEREPLLDSADMRPPDWLRIARDIAERAETYSGFVVLHGTDTLAYTASALSFLLAGLAKPVVVTGSQLPLSETRSDGWDNLVTSLIVASHASLREVAVTFDHAILRGNRTVKVDADRFGAFVSPSYPALGEAGVDIELRRELLLRPEPRALELPRSLDARLAVLRLFPGITSDLVEHVLRAPIEGVVLECYGAGTAPTRDPALLDAIERAVEQGMVVVAVSQCLNASVELKTYAAGRGLAERGVTSGHDLTTEAALSKLYWLFARGLEPEEVRRQLAIDLAGELTAPEDG